MFEEKVTVQQFEGYKVGLEEDISKGFRLFERRFDQQEQRLNRYSSRLYSIIDQIDNIKGVIDHNALQGEKTNGAIREAYERIDDVKTAIELLAAEQGVSVEVLPEIPTTVTIQPGLPERLGVVKMTKAEIKEANKMKGTIVRDSMALPSPLQLTASELTQGLSLVQD